MSDAKPKVDPAMGVDEAVEKQLAGQLKTLYDALQAEKPDYRKVIKDITAIRKMANDLQGKAEKTDPPEVDTPSIPAQVPLVEMDGITTDEVRAAWKEQLVFRVRGVYEMLTYDILKPLPEWGEVCGVGWPHWKDRWRRARKAAAALREAHVFALLLDGGVEPLKIKKSDVLFKDDLKKKSENWLMYGPCVTTWTETGLRRKNKRVRNADMMIWTKKAFGGNFLFEFTFVANNGGKHPGLLFAVCGKPVKEGTDLSVSCGETMGTYNDGIHAYHFSMHRGLTGICNGRKVGSGLNLIGSRTPDPATETGKAYRVTIGKWGNGVFLLVDGKMIHYYYDGETFGPALKDGHVGMRHWGGADATYSDVKVYRLEKE